MSEFTESSNQKRGRILYMGGFELPDKNAAAQRVMANAKVLHKIGFEVILIGVSKSIENGSPFFASKNEYDGFEYYSISYPNDFISWINYLFQIDIYHISNFKPTHIIAYNFPSFGLSKLIEFGKKKNVKIIGDVTEWYLGQGNLIKKLIKEIDVFYRMKILHFKLDGLIVISDFLEKYYSVKHNNVINIPPLVNLELPKWPKEIIKKRANEKIKIIYAGSPGLGNKDRIDWIIKNICDLVQIEKLNLELKIIGISQEQYFTLFKKTNEEIKINSCVVFLGRMEHSEVLKEVNNADFQLFLRESNLSNNAGFPTKFAESISCGTPVITNPTSNLSSFLTEGKSGFLLDSISEKDLKIKLLEIFKLNQEEIFLMKTFCLNSRMFQYLNYINTFEKFFYKI